jgi:hypothetical protein
MPKPALAFLALFLATLIAASVMPAAPARAAPMWLERQSAPKSDLIDPGFASSDAASAIAVDHARWNSFLQKYLIAGEDGISRVRYGAVSADDRANLDAYLGGLEALDPAALSRHEQLAFWINLYNAATVRLILDHPGVTSIRDIGKPWDTPVANISGRALTLNMIEHGIVRPAFNDPRTHYALNCASLGCPNLAHEAYAGAVIEAELDAAAAAYVNHPRGVTVDAGRVAVSKLYGWYGGDFGAGDKGVLDHIRRYASPALLEALQGATRISAWRYDWALNAAP